MSQIQKEEKTKLTILKVIWDMLEHPNQTFERKGPPGMYWSVKLQILSKMKSHVLIWEKLILRKKFTQFFKIVLHVMKIEVSLLLGCSSR